MEEYRLVMRNLELHYQDFLRDSQDSEQFAPADRMQVEGDFTKTTQHFDNLLRSLEKGELSQNLSFVLCEVLQGGLFELTWCNKNCGTVPKVSE